MFPLILALAIGADASCPDSGDSGQPTRASLVLHGIRGMDWAEVDRALAEQGEFLRAFKGYFTLHYARAGLDVSFESYRVFQVTIHRD
jgi:hypothetical protein